MFVVLVVMVVGFLALAILRLVSNVIAGDAEQRARSSWRAWDREQGKDDDQA